MILTYQTTEIMPKNTYIGAEMANNSIYEAYQTNKDAWHANKDGWRLNKDVWWKSLIKNKGCRFVLDRKKLIPAPLIKEFFLPKYDKIVPI